jgi:hypothetical protein
MPEALIEIQFPKRLSLRPPDGRPAGVPGGNPDQIASSACGLLAMYTTLIVLR